MRSGMRIDGPARAHTSWDKAALLRGYENAMELSAREVCCAELPNDLRGTYYRNGPARFVGYDGQKIRHPFDADGLVTAVTLDGPAGTAVVRQRYVATRGAVEERRAGRSLYPGIFGNPLPLWAGGATVKNLANTNVFFHGGRLLALYEGCRPHELDPLSLATLREWDVDGVVGSGMRDGFSAHPRIRPDGGVCNFAAANNLLAGTTTLRFWEFAPGSFSLKVPAQVRELPGYSLFHDFLVTDSWYILLAPPSVWGSLDSPLRTFKRTIEWAIGLRPLTSMIEFTPGPTVVHLIPRPQGTTHRAVQAAANRSVTVKLDTSFFAFHHANAFEDVTSGTVTFDTVSLGQGKESLPNFEAISGDEPSLRSTWGPLAGLVRRLRRIASEERRYFARRRTKGQSHNLHKRGKKPQTRFLLEEHDYEGETPRATLVRYTVHLESGQVTKSALSPRHVEFPSVAPAVAGARHRYIYSTPGASVDVVTPQRGVLKTDTLDASRSQMWMPPTPYEYCGEAIFTPRARGRSEDDGYLLTLCFDGRDGTSSLLVLDALDVAAGPIARVAVSDATDASELPADATIAGPGHGLHATFVPSLVPTLEEVQAAEAGRRQRSAAFLADHDGAPSRTAVVLQSRSRPGT